MAETPRILIATGIYPPEIGGPATYAKLLYDRLPEYGLDAKVLPFREVRGYPKALRHILYWWKIIEESRDVDVVFTQDPVSTGIPAVFAAFVTKKPLVMRVAGDYAWEQSVNRYGVKETIDEFQTKQYGPRVEFLRFLQRFSVRHATAVISPSKYFRDLVSNWNRGKREVKHIYNGIDFSTVFEKKEPYQQKTIITAGRLVPWKGIDMVISLLVDLPNWNLIIAGDGPERERLEAFAKKEEVFERVRFTKNITREELFSEIFRSRVFVLNTSFESFSFQIVESMFVGTPVISTNIGNISEIIDSGKEGILLPPNDRGAFLAAIRELDEKEELRKSLVEAARKKSEMFSIENTVRSVALIFKELDAMPRRS